MAAPIASAAAAYASTLAKADQPGMDPPGGDGKFSGMVQSAIGNVAETLRAGEQASMAAVAGKASMAEVVNAVNNADVTLQAVMAVRDRVVQAYQDILRMPM